MTAAWTRVGNQNRCPICGSDACCELGPAGGVWCSLGDQPEVPGYNAVPRKLAGAVGHEAGLFVPEDGAFDHAADAAFEPTQEDRDRRSVLRRQREERDETEAAELIRKSKPQDSLAMAWSERAGVPVSMLTALPDSLRVIRKAPRWAFRDGAWVELEPGTALVFVKTELGGRRFVMLEHVGASGESDDLQDERRGMATVSRGAVRLYAPERATRLVVAATVFSGLAIAAAAGGAVWAAGSNDALALLELPSPSELRGCEVVYALDWPGEDGPWGLRRQRLLEAGGGDVVGGGVSHVVDAVRHAAKVRAGVRMSWTVPTETVQWGSLFKKSGRAAVLGALADGAEMTVSQEDQAADQPDPDAKILEDNRIDRAWRALRDLYTIKGGGLSVRRWDERWWRYDGTKYVVMSEEAMFADLQRWSVGFTVWRSGRGGRRPMPMDSAPKTIKEIRESMQSCAFVESDGMPVWTAPDFGQDGEVLFTNRRPWQTVVREQDLTSEKLPSPRDVTVFANGLFDLKAWLGGGMRLLPHSERMFTATSLPFEFPVAELRDIAGDDEAVLDLAEQMAPVWFEFLEVASQGDPSWRRLLQQFMGYSLTPWVLYEAILLMVGQSRAGKGVILNRWTHLLGEENVVSSDMGLLTDKFHLATFLGKSLLVLPDADVGKSTDAVKAGETLKKITGGDPLYMDRKYLEPIPAKRVFLKPLVMCNRMPSLPDPNGGLANRFCVLPFERSAAGSEERKYKDQAVINQEAAGVMLWALLGLRDLVRNHGFVQPESGMHLLEEYRDYSDPLRKFISECVEPDEHAFISTAELYKAWSGYCNKTGRDAHSEGWFAMQFATASHGGKRGQNGADGSRSRGYQGIKLSISAAYSIDQPSLGLPT